MGLLVYIYLQFLTTCLPLCHEEQEQFRQQCFEICAEASKIETIHNTLQPRTPYVIPSN